MNDFVIIIPNKYPELARNLIGSIVAAHDPPPRIAVVADNHETKFLGAQTLKAEGPFVYAKSVNIGMSAFPYDDVVLCNDDTECVEERFFFHLQDMAYKYQRIGILSPLIDGGVGNPWQQWPESCDWSDRDIKTDTVCLEDTICFPCVYIKRDVVSKIGKMDETFVGYGEDDVDYCIRAREAGYLTGISRNLKIKHGTGGNVLERGKNWSTSFAREKNVKSNIPRLRAKYGF